MDFQREKYSQGELKNDCAGAGVALNFSAEFHNAFRCLDEILLAGLTFRQAAARRVTTLDCFGEAALLGFLNVCRGLAELGTDYAAFKLLGQLSFGNGAW